MAICGNSFVAFVVAFRFSFYHVKIKVLLTNLKSLVGEFSHIFVIHSNNKCVKYVF